MAMWNDGFWAEWIEESRWSLWVIAVSIICFQLLSLAIYRIFFHPLAKYPGPLLSKLSDIPAVWYAVRNQDTYHRYALHQKYGSVTRTSPNELCFADAASIKDIYGQSGEPCLKSPWFFDGFTLTGESSVFSTTDRNLHARMRRLLSHGFSQQTALQFQGDILAKIEKFLQLISSSSQPINLYDPANNLYLDTTSQLSFGKSFNLLDGEESQGAQDIATYFSIAPLFGRFPLAKDLPFGIFRLAKEARPRIVEFAQNCIDDFRERLRLSTAQQGILAHMIEAKDGETGTTFSDEELIENVAIFIIAGSGTTASTLLYLIYEMGQRPEMQFRLETEIRSAFPDPTVLPNFETAADLPYLNNVISEVLRLRGPLPTSSPRVSPGKVIAGEYVPAGTTVSNLPYSTHRDPTVFPDPETFNPDRWEASTPEMKVMYRPFQTGPRNCIGVHLARIQLMVTACAMYQQLEILVDTEKTTKEMMVLRDQGLMMPMGKQLWVRAARRALQ